MAKVRKGSPLDGLSGRVGDLVFRTRGDQTIVSRRPSGRDPQAPRSARLKQTLTRFQEAVRFAREARHRSAFRSLSRTLRGYSPYHVALQDYLSIPVIQSVDTSGVGHRGGEVTIRVAEKIAVRSVRVKLAGSAAGGRAPALEPSATQAAPASRPAIPAHLFFRRAEPRGEAPHRLPPITQEDSALPLPPGGAEVELRAARHLGVASDAEGGGMRVEVWRLRIPRPGGITIIAADYAGNRAVHRLHAGPQDMAPGDRGLRDEHGSGV